MTNNTDRPPVPPDAAAIRLAREGAGLSMARAAERARMSKARWVQIENGRETRRGQVFPVQAKPVTIAHMAYAVGLPPERLESEGKNPEAALILREIIRQAEASTSIFALQVAQARPYADDIYARLLDLAAEGKRNPRGPEIFDSWKDAESWDKQTNLPMRERVWLIAMASVRLAEHLQSHLQAVVSGWAAAGLSCRSRSRPRLYFSSRYILLRSQITMSASNSCRGQGRTLRIRQNHGRAWWSVVACELLPAEDGG